MMNRGLKKGLIFGLVLFLLLSIAAGLAKFYYEMPITSANSSDEKIELVVNKNETGNSIAEQLYKKGLIKSVFMFKVALRLTDTVDKLQEGYYQFPKDSSMKSIVQGLQSGQVRTIKVTIPEGFTIQQIAKRLEENKVVSAQEFLDEAKVYVPYLYMYGPTPEEYHVEGFLFPETYNIPVNYTAKDIITMMTSEMNKHLTPEVKAKIKEKNLSIYQFITLASLVEREALFDKDRPIIAAVFEKRLKERMPLQSCASIEYVLGTRKKFLSLEDIEINSPYNTYKYAGLPPGPISNPGIKSINAVLDAKPTEYLYFVADEKGIHHFSKTYQEHLEKIESIYGNNRSN